MAGKVRLRDTAAAPAEHNGQVIAQPTPLAPLRVSGVVVRKGDLVEALRVYVPALRDLQVTEDGEHFWLLLGEPQPVGDPAAS